MADVTRRTILGGTLAAVALAGTTVAVALTEKDELGRLIEAHRAANAEYERRVDVYGEWEKALAPGYRRTPEGKAEDDRMHDWYSDVPDDEALMALCEYRPRTFEEVRRRADYLRSGVPMLEDLEPEYFLALIASTASAEVA